MTDAVGPGPAGEDAEQARDRSAPRCSTCGEPTRFAGGMSTHDLYAERFLCDAGHESYRSFGRGSVS